MPTTDWFMGDTFIKEVGFSKHRKVCARAASRRAGSSNPSIFHVNSSKWPRSTPGHHDEQGCLSLPRDPDLCLFLFVYSFLEDPSAHVFPAQAAMPHYSRPQWREDVLAYSLVWGRSALLSGAVPNQQDAL